MYNCIVHHTEKEKPKTEKQNQKQDRAQMPIAKIVE